LIDSNVELKSGENASAVAALDEKGLPSLLNFVNDFASVAKNKARIILTNAADAPALKVTLQSVTTKEKFTYQVNPGAKDVTTLPSDLYDVEVEANGSIAVPFQPLPLPSVSTTLIYAVGSAGNGSLSLVTKTVRDVL
jgi:hypothetical protein